MDPNECHPAHTDDCAVPPEEMKRLTIDIPRTVHRQLKTIAARSDVSMAKLLRDMLVERLASEDR